MMPKVHELLAVEGQLKGQAEAARKDLTKTFSSKRHLFEEKRVTFTPSAEGAQTVVESQSDIQSTIGDELKWIANLWRQALDVSLNVQVANAQATADVVLDDGTILLKAVPTTALLELEKRAGEIQELITAIPTLDPAKGFAPDEARKGGIYKAREVVKTRTRKEQKPLVLYPATDKHPAQTQLISEDVNIGTIQEQEWSGLITPKLKGELLERAEELRRAVKKARMRANDFEIKADDLRKCGDAIFGYVFGTN